jgi:hypothetical protein
MQTTFTLHGKTYSISRDDVLRIARSVEPDLIDQYYVEVHGRRFPPTQLVCLAAETSTRPHPRNSRSILERLGFTPCRVNKPRQADGPPLDHSTLASLRHKLLNILDQLDGRAVPRASPSARIAQLQAANRLPRTVAAQMRVVLEQRNVAEYENAKPTLAQAEAVRSSWIAILEWAKAQGITV